MNSANEVRKTRSFSFRLPHGCDLLNELTRFCSEQKITLGRLEAIGAVSSANIGFYDQSTREYRFTRMDRPMEIVKLAGNISLKDNHPFVHAHIALADRDGRMYGGHLAEGTMVFACECFVESLEGPARERVLDMDTGLALWKTT